MTDAAEHFAQTWLKEHGSVLYSYALSRVGGDEALAEDLVQETLLAGIQGFDKFQQRAKVETWLVGILRRKVIDHYRKIYRKNREINVDEFFSPKGHLKNIAEWQADPQQSFQNQEFWAVFDGCLSKLNASLAEAFMICVMDDIDTKEACRLLDVTATNLSVRLHRARLGLRQCLQSNWFGRS